MAQAKLEKTLITEEGTEINKLVRVTLEVGNRLKVSYHTLSMTLSIETLRPENGRKKDGYEKFTK